ncbi:hypothetical protein Ancab_015436 [Ancistrocladus abbreviatus]
MAPMQMDKSSCKHDGSQQNQLNGHIENGGSNHGQDRKPADAAGGMIVDGMRMEQWDVGNALSVMNPAFTLLETTSRTARRGRSIRRGNPRREDTKKAVVMRAAISKGWMGAGDHMFSGCSLVAVGWLGGVPCRGRSGAGLGDVLTEILVFELGWLL